MKVSNPRDSHPRTRKSPPSTPKPNEHEPSSRTDPNNPPNIASSSSRPTVSENDEEVNDAMYDTPAPCDEGIVHIGFGAIEPTPELRDDDEKRSSERDCEIISLENIEDRDRHQEMQMKIRTVEIVHTEQSCY